MKSLVILILLTMISLSWAQNEMAGKCMTCHKLKSPGLYKQWYESQHGMHEVTCLDCHGASKSEADAFLHEGAYIATLVTPEDCGNCHEKEAREVQNSYHATAGEILDSQDAYLAHVTGGEPAAILGCESCHGAKVIIDDNSPNKLSKKSWPNSGIGRINPDGSKGSCNTCHTRHNFDKTQARQPEACGKCHLGPDHPQMEIYEESKHGNTYYTNIDKMNLHSDKWVVGEDYFVAPTCATCHMSATPSKKLSHDVGERLSWTLRPAISVHKDNWQQKRKNMLTVCQSCHGSAFAEGHYYQYDALVHLYNEKFAKPATDIMNLVIQEKLLENPASFGNKIEWTYWELWHHEGRRARHGASMMGPDYTWWHGIYEVVQHFYFKFIPEAQSFKNKKVDDYIKNLFEKDATHQWLSTNTEELKKGIRSGKLQQKYQELFIQDK
ncbi:MAG: hypothetical protein JXB44_13230 [Calditrichaceae bacterium]|nr:hypothetical protein [Calditrichaceae bacterium]RQV92853.1 MAG: hypothetical protein EH224_14135 [Calditrichota bacterium]